MGRRLLQLATALLGTALLAVAVMVMGMRRRSPLVIDTMRRVNKAVFNPAQMSSAGSPGSYAGIVEHVGRRSGTPYRTPIGPYPTDDGFIVALPYGTRADWVRNVLAAGSAVIVHEGEEHAVADPEVVAVADVIEDIPAGERRGLGLFGVTDCLRVNNADDRPPGS